MADLVALVADKDAQVGLGALLKRHKELNVRRIDFNVHVHPQHDPGVLQRAHDFLRVFLKDHQYALVVFDREGCGQESMDTAELRALVQERLDKNGWKDRSMVLVLDPELERWLWSDLDALGRVIEACPEELRSFLEKVKRDLQGKPLRPKETFRELLRYKGVRVSSSLFGEIAAHADFSSCSDPMFSDFLRTLQRWFPATASASGGHP